jgi:serine/threonine protein kinase/tetratricopeptide (TPR) repeat protein
MTGQTISHYNVLEKLGEGGMGVVYKAQDKKLDRTVALKFLPSHLSASQDNKERFRHEARATAALNHPNILAVFDIDEIGGQLFFAMEYIEGKTLKKRITESREGIPLQQAIEWVTRIAEGLRAAHEKNITHRDIKPENIMLLSDGQVKIMDFGIAKLKGATGMTRTGVSLGTLAYMSPEQAQGIPADHRSDIWSLGVVLYEMLTGEVPFKAEHEAGLLYLVVNSDPPVPSAMDKRIPRQVDPVVMTMLQKDREKRYHSMSEVLKVLEQTRKEIDTASAPAKAKAVAVLPFGDISQDKESDYFGDGLTEELIVNLSKLKEIRVIPRATSMQYRGSAKDVKTIGRELSTRYILSGNVRKFQDNLRISVELIDVDTEEQLWAETYKGTLADVFDIQEKVSKQIVEALMVKLTPSEKVVLSKRSTLNAEAFDCYLRARVFLNRRTRTSVNMAIQYFQKAIELDPRYAAAYAGLGESYGTLYRDFERREMWLDKALEVSLKAIMYDATLSEAYASLALAYLGKSSFNESLEACQKAILLDHKNFNAYWILSRIYRSTEREKEAREALEKVITLTPSFLQALDDLLNLYERLGDQQKFNEILNKALEVYPLHLAQHPDDAYRRMSYAVNLTYAGRLEGGKREGEKALELSVGDPIMMYYGACLYSRLGDKKRAVELIRDAVANGYENFNWIKQDPDFESIRNESGYIELMKGK